MTCAKTNNLSSRIRHTQFLFSVQEKIEDTREKWGRRRASNEREISFTLVRYSSSSWTYSTTRFRFHEKSMLLPESASYFSLITNSTANYTRHFLGFIMQLGHEIVFLYISHRQSSMTHLFVHLLWIYLYNFASFFFLLLFYGKKLCHKIVRLISHAHYLTGINDTECVARFTVTQILAHRFKDHNSSQC